MERSTTSAASPALMTVDEVADHLSLGRSRVYEFLRSGELHSVKLGAARRVRPEDVESFISARRT